MKKQFLIYAFVLLTSTLSAQLFEAGGFIGGSNYIGDIGPTTYINPNKIAYGLVTKFNYKPRITFRGTLIYTVLEAHDSKAESSFRRNRNRSFGNAILEASGGVEFHFRKYSLSKTGFTNTPYIFAEAGLVNYRMIDGQNSSLTATSKRVTSMVFPFGLGYKMKLAESVGIAFETSFRYTFKDVIDKNNHEINDPQFNFGDPNSDDWYVFTGITIVYAFGRPGCYSGAF